MSLMARNRGTILPMCLSLEDPRFKVANVGALGPALILGLVEIATFNNLLLFQTYYLNGNHNITLLTKGSDFIKVVNTIR